jgi:hypothetical protein
MTPDNANSAAKRRRRRAWPPEVMDAIRDLAAQGYIAKEIDDRLALDPDMGDLPRPSVRSLQRLLADISPEGMGRWAFGADDAAPGPDYDRLVLQTLGAVMAATEGRVRGLSQAEAEWVVRIRRARPDFTPAMAYRFARRYIEWRARGESTEALDLQLASANPVVEGMTDDALNDRARRHLAAGKRERDGGRDVQTR